MRFPVSLCPCVHIVFLEMYVHMFFCVPPFCGLDVEDMCGPSLHVDQVLGQATQGVPLLERDPFFVLYSTAGDQLLATIDSSNPARSGSLHWEVDL